MADCEAEVAAEHRAVYGARSALPPPPHSPLFLTLPRRVAVILVAVLLALIISPMGSISAYLPAPSLVLARSPETLRVPHIALVLLAAINRDRAAHHAPALRLDARQSGCSLKHTRHMSKMDTVSHDQFPGDVCTPHAIEGENVGLAPGSPSTAVLTLDRTMMAEGPCPHRLCPGKEFEAHGHYVTLMNPAYKRIGVGVYFVGGVTWLTEDFVG
jgi:Cysteine-rich secretory protein family